VLIFIQTNHDAREKYFTSIAGRFWLAASLLQGTVPRVTTATEPAIKGARARAWLVDDSDLQREIGRRLLARQYDVQVFADGATLLEALGAGGKPDVLVLDWHMPDMSGLDVCKFIRETRDAGSLPILISTATGGEDLAEALAAGANDFVHKPCPLVEFEARIAALLRNKRIHERLVEAEQRLRIEGEFRERFMGMLAHDLRQPLNAFLFANHAIEQAVASTSVISLLAIQSRAANRMTRMIAELLDFTRSRPETGMPIERRPMELEAVARSVIDEMRIAHPSRSFRLTSRGPCTGCWDRDRLTQICSNLIGNAIEHSSSPASPIDVEVSERPEHVELAVSNAGTPIPASLLPSLFEPFRRGRDAKQTNGGLGLGLFIVKEIARAHGGTVSAQSDMDATVFRVSLPRAPSCEQGP
jgi:sigma-B regulation protein RsbU (phosphoserine phosphatase)